ncbi:MAG: hypothetical protein R3183_06845 [Oleiphilaceae bacterium]|nr:hypothetical protein [Oleiphilaceae bacterium]
MILLPFILLPIHLCMIALCYLLSPVLPLFAIGRDTLPYWLSWFQTPDAPIDGDSGFQRVAPWVKWRYARRVMWLIRNPAYGFSWSVLAARPARGAEIKVIGNIASGDDPYIPGWSFTWIPGTHYWQVRAFIKTVPGKCLKARLGWKMKHDALHYGETGGKPYKFTFTCNPFKARR